MPPLLYFNSHSPSQRDPARVLLPLGLGTALSLMGDSALYTVLPTHTAEAGITLASVGLMLSVNRFIRILSNGPSGLLYDRWPRRKLFIASLVLGVFSTLMYAIGKGFWPLLLGRLLWGLSWSGIWVGGTAIILDVTDDVNRGRWTGLYQTWFFLGAAVSAFAGGLFTDWFGYRTAMGIGTGLSAIGVIAAIFLLPETGTSTQSKVGSGTGAFVAGPAGMQFLKNRGIWLAALLYAINRFAMAGVLAATMALLITEKMGHLALPVGLATLTGVLLGGRTLFSMASAPLSGVLSDRMGGRWPVLLAASLTGSVGMALMAWGAPLAILAGVIGGSIAGGALQALASVLAGDLVRPAQRGRAVGMLHTIGDFSSAVAPLFSYALLPLIGLSGVYWLTCGLFFLGAAAIYSFIRRPAAEGL